VFFAFSIKHDIKTRFIEDFPIERHKNPKRPKKHDVARPVLRKMEKYQNIGILIFRKKGGVF
jgi:hypothetical protein